MSDEAAKPREQTSIWSAVLSFFLPGAGQYLRGWRSWGTTLLTAFIVAIALFVWRIHLLAHLEKRIGDTVRKAFHLAPFFVGLTAAGLLLFWLWNIRNAWDGKGKRVLIALMVLIYITLGWQISQIDLYKLATELGDAWPPLSRIVWPWPAAIERDMDTLTASAEILVPCGSGPTPPPPVEEAGQPYLRADPTCGTLSSLDEENQIVPGTTLHLTGRNFSPNTKTEIWWSDPIGNEFRVRQEGEYVSLMTDAEGSFQIDIVMPYRLIPPSAEGLQIHKVIARQEAPIGRPHPSEALLISIEKMIETIFLGMMATAFGILFAVPISFLAAKNMMSGSPLTLAIYYVVRTILNIVRSIEPMIWAILAVVVVGLGPFAGLIALVLHTIAALGKLYSEAVESIDPGPIEAIQATGATKLQTIMYAVIPQVIPPFVSFSIYRWDINVRMSTIIGMVGGGGIGFLLTQYIRLMDYRSAGIAVWFITITVATLDFISSKIRERFV